MQKYALVYDTETNGFYDEATIMWTFCAKDMRTGQRWTFGGPDGVYKDREAIQALFLNSDMVICHNQIKHDLPVLAKLGIVGQKHWRHAKVLDTFVISSVLNPDRPIPPGCKGGHSLEAYGVLSGGEVEKVQHENWLEFDQNMIVRCESDVDLTEYTYRYLAAEASEDKWDWKRAIDMEHKVAFIIAKQERNGWQFDVDGANALVERLDAEIEAIDAKLKPLLPPLEVPEDKAPKFPEKKFTKDGKPTAQALKYWRTELETFDGDPADFLRSEAASKPKKFFTEQNPGSQNQMKDFLLTQGWKPIEYTEKGSPKITEESLKSVKGEAGELVAHRFVVMARRTLLKNTKDDEKGLINLVRPDGRISAVANPCATPTGRMRHKNVVNIPASRSEYGSDIRGLFITKKVPGTPVWTFESHGKVITVDDGSYALVGCDAAGLELRNLASRMGDRDFINMIVNGKKEEGTDVHTFFKNVLCDFIDTRDEAKTIEYAMIYGAGDEKLGKIAVRGPKDLAKRGKAVREKIAQEIPALDDLVKHVKMVAKRGYLKGLDGRKIWVRSEHAALNSLLQCDGALVMKVALLELQKNATRDRIDFAFVGNIHDEVQAEVYPLQAVQFAELARNSIRDAGVILGMMCPLEGESNIGKSWADTH